MNRLPIILAENLAVALVSFGIGYLIREYLSRTRLKAMEAESERVLTDARTKYREIELEAKDLALRLREEAETEDKKRRAEVRAQEQRLQQRRESLDRRVDSLEARERAIQAKERGAEQKETEVQKLYHAAALELERVAGMDRQEARVLLLKSVEQDTRQDMARIIRQVETEVQEEAERKAREIITLAIQRFAADQVTETTVSSVPLPNDEMKGRIIGRGGRNIRAIEAATGVDLVVDDTPEAIILSSFDPVRREIARVAITKLIVDGRIHPARIEKVVKKAQQDVDESIREEGERAAYETGVHGLHPELVRLLGRLQYRTSYGQNVLMHSVETAHLAAMMAAEIGADVEFAKEAGLLHDIGKAIDHEIDGPHALIGADVARRLGKTARIVNAIAAHHSEEEPQSIEAILVQSSDAISGARPGARRESLENYIKRIKALENIAESFEGVERSYAIQAGREIRIIVKPEAIDDLAAMQLARDIAKRIEEGLEYPGQIRVTVVRETRAVEYAK